ncbi:DUF6496 domain-containing protein [Microvirga pakistanensis]|uniref:DUF6496 domain-containing protein n=1 Tax=Microvirga pakistanensis TaxID=1682650 RepID=UPI00106BF474|nr:DUF6496 domain-containing protein [Microvirga pakistanensis]
MARQQSKAQKDTVHRVMHEFKEGKLKIRGSGPKVKNPKQAIAIALREAGASNQESPKKNRENLSKTKAKEHRGETASKKSASKKTASPRERLGGKASKAGRAQTRAELYAEAKRRDLPGRSRMSKGELERSLDR